MNVGMNEKFIDKNNSCPQPQPQPGCSGSNLMPCACPVNLGKEVLNASTDGRKVVFDVEIQNLCGGMDYLVLATIYKVEEVMGKCVKIKKAEVCKKVRRNGIGCGTIIEHFEVIIPVSLCSGEKIDIEVTGNYVMCCN